VPKLQSVGWVCQFLRWQRNYEIPSSAAFGKIGEAYVADIHRWAKVHGVSVRRFAKGENKEALARPLIEAAEREGGDGRVVLIGIAQEKTPVWWSWKAKGQENVPHPHMEWGRQMAFVNHFYFYLWDPEWGGAFWKTNAYAPWPVWIWLNAHAWAQRQCDRLGIGYTALDNYDLRRLKRKGLIVRLPGHHRYQLTPLGRRVAVLFTKAYGRVLTPGLAALDPRLPPHLATRTPLATAWRHLDHTPRAIHQRRTRRCMIVKLGLTVNPVVGKRS
jgi:hypothetical protein